jgi:hypothetical protein
LAVAEPPTKPISPGSAAAVKAATAIRRNHLPRNFSLNFITATNPPFITCHKAIAVAFLRNETRVRARFGLSTLRYDVAVG